MRQTATQTRDRDTRVPSRQCDVENCKEPTRERKPYCSTHILRDDRAGSLFAKIEGAGIEITKVSKKGPEAVDMDGLVVEEILAELMRIGSPTWRKLCKSVSFLYMVQVETTNHYLTRLYDEKLVDVGRNKRSSRVVSLTPKGLRVARKGV